MARYLYGGTAADVTTTQAGRLVTGATLTVWDSQSGGTQITDLQDATGTAATVVTSDAYGRVLFYGPDNDTRSFWLESNVGGRLLVRPAASIMPANDSVDTVHLKNGSVTSAKIADGTIVNADVNAAAAIDRSKISGLPTSSTDNTIPRFDGTGGALQTSGIVVDDNDNVTSPGSIRAEKSGTCAVTARSTGSEAYLTAAGTNAWVQFQSGSQVLRFAVFAIGDELRIRRYDGSGGFLADSLVIDRTNGRVRLGDAGSAGGLEFGSSGPRIMSGSGSPNSVVSAPVGSLWLRTDGGSNTTLYVKESGTGNTGWVAK